MKAKILLIEGKRAEHPSFASGLTKKGFLVESVPNGSAALEHLEHDHPKVVVLDAASLRTSGRRICLSIRQHAPGLPLVVVLDQQANGIDKLNADVILVQPFTLQKLLNRMRPLIPEENQNILHVGALQLDIEQRLVRCGKRQVRLTPRLLTLLKMLMDNPGIVIDRRDMFRQVWETEYIGDTRTLDVHISWLRQALEEDPRRPRYIKTVRGVGYRLDA